MLAKLLLVALALFNIYVVVTVSKASRQDILNTLKLIPSRFQDLLNKTPKRPDDKETEVVKETPPPVPRTVKMDFTEKCNDGGVICNDGKESLNCSREVKYSKSRCMNCECSICAKGKCPPATRGYK